MDENKAAFIAEKTIALVGASSQRGFGNTIFRELRKKGYRVLPLSTTADSVDGERCYRSLDELPEPVGGVLTVVPPQVTERIVPECARLGIRRIWMQQGSESPEAIRLCTEHGLAAVHHACILMYVQPTFPHSWHGWFWRLIGKY